MLGPLLGLLLLRPPVSLALAHLVFPVRLRLIGRVPPTGLGLTGLVIPVYIFDDNCTISWRSNAIPSALSIFASPRIRLVSS